MAVFAANITDETVGLIDKVFTNDQFVRFGIQNNLNLKDKTILVRLALINLIKHIPTNEEVTKYKAALLRPHEFDDFWKQGLGRMKNVK